MAIFRMAFLMITRTVCLSVVLYETGCINGHFSSPNLGAQSLDHARFGDLEINSCTDLESAAKRDQGSG